MKILAVHNSQLESQLVKLKKILQEVMAFEEKKMYFIIDINFLEVQRDE